MPEPKKRNGFYVQWTAVIVLIAFLGFLFTVWIGPLTAEVHENTGINIRQDECQRSMSNDLREIKQDVKKLLERGQ